VYLETAGIHDEALNILLPWVDIIAMDIKLPSSADTGEYWEAHRKFLKSGREKDLFVKMIVTQTTEDMDVMKGIRLVAETAPEVPVFFQPVTASGKIQAPSASQLTRWKGWAAEHLNVVFVTPQVHRLIGLP